MTREIPLKRKEDLPEGSLALREFAKACGVEYGTMDCHVRRGFINKQTRKREYIEITTIRGTHNAQRYLTPDQQRVAIEFWDRHGIPHRKPVESEVVS